VLNRSISTGKLTTLAQAEIEAFEGEIDHQQYQNEPVESGKGFEETLREHYSFQNDEDYAAQILGATATQVERAGSGTGTRPAATDEERRMVAKLFKVLKASEAQGPTTAQKEAKAEHACFIEWLQKARIFRRLDLTRRQQQSSHDLGSLSFSPLTSSVAVAH
jgi:hypothetical protein